jgi:hypothetical protein
VPASSATSGSARRRVSRRARLTAALVSGPRWPAYEVLSFFAVLRGLLATHVAGGKCRSASEEDEGQGEAGADAGVTPVEAACRRLIPEKGGDQAPRRLRIPAGERATEPVWLVRVRCRAMVAVAADQLAIGEVPDLELMCLDRSCGARGHTRRSVDVPEGREVGDERLIAVRLDGRAFVHLRLRDGGREGYDRQPESDPLDKPVPSPKVRIFPAPSSDNVRLRT